jgi:hypothetical protein
LIFGAHNPQVRRLLTPAASAAAIAALALAQGGAASLSSLGSFFFGPKLVRAEVVTSEGGVIHDYRVDRGRIRAVTPSSLNLLEKDGTTVAVPVAATANVTLGGATVPLTRLKRGFMATTVRDGSASASIVVATRR